MAKISQKPTRGEFWLGDIFFLAPHTIDEEKFPMINNLLSPPSAL
jgi:hypothetical protein